ncbi:hypothetical protein [Actinopolymorpha pittospori]
MVHRATRVALLLFAAWLTYIALSHGPDSAVAHELGTAPPYQRTLSVEPPTSTQAISTQATSTQATSTQATSSQAILSDGTHSCGTAGSEVATRGRTLQVNPSSQRAKHHPQPGVHLTRADVPPGWQVRVDPAPTRRTSRGFVAPSHIALQKFRC